MENDFLDGIDEQFQRLMNANGNGKAQPSQQPSRSKIAGLIPEIVDRVSRLSDSQQNEVLTFIQSLEKH